MMQWHILVDVDYNRGLDTNGLLDYGMLPIIIYIINHALYTIEIWDIFY